MTLDLDELEREAKAKLNGCEAMCEEYYAPIILELIAAARELQAVEKLRAEEKEQMHYYQQLSVKFEDERDEAVAHLTTLIENGGVCCIALAKPCDTHREIKAFLDGPKDGDA